MENRPVKSYFVSPDDAKLDELRRAVKFDKVSGDVRLVEIDNFDLSACAGTNNNTAYNTETPYSNVSPTQDNNDGSYGYNTGW